jgi:hypothetical protein
MHHGRDPVVDLVRAMAVSIVVVWHTTLSVVHFDDGRLVMGSPSDAVAGGWVATWLLQVMPAFFVVGGYVHLGAWRSAPSIGRSCAAEHSGSGGRCGRCWCCGRWPRWRCSSPGGPRWRCRRRAC